MYLLKKSLSASKTFGLANVKKGKASLPSLLINRSTTLKTVVAYDPLSLGELEPCPRAFLAVLFAFLGSGVAGQQTFLTELAARFAVHSQKRL